MITEDDLDRARKERHLHRMKIYRAKNPKRVHSEKEKQDARERSAKWKKENRERYNAYHRDYSQYPMRQEWREVYYRTVLKPRRAAAKASA